ncbi:MAG TPA: hypothetical protein VFR04_04090 [Solirubrobacterales bacterium]|nr:hypothetical protein [Solirubrobacterales bacterium]
MARSRWKLTVRSGSSVEQAGFDDLDSAIAAMRERALGIRAGARPKTASLLGTYTPADQVQARLQLQGRGLLSKPTAGIDVRGDGTFVPYRGGVGREELDPSAHETPFDLVRETLEAGRR